MKTLTTTLEKPVKVSDLFKLNNQERPKKFPVAVTVCRTEKPPAVLQGNLPACAERKEEKPVPVGIFKIELKRGPIVFVDGKQVEIPNGAKKKLTVRALKKLSKAYPGSIFLAKKGNSWVRLRNWEVVDVPDGKEVECKTMPSFRLE